MKNCSYVGGMVWVSPVNLSVTYTNREQTSALTVLCKAPSFICKEVKKHRKRHLLSKNMN